MMKNKKIMGKNYEEIKIKNNKDKIIKKIKKNNKI